ncbi:MAG: recombinase family protein [Succinivibrio sp.]|nr:recombinase family protein [Succinivibrio sp.]
MKYGYARVSSQDQNLDRQIDALKAEGIRQIDIYSDKKSGKDLKRKGLTEVLERLQENDELVITSLDRLSRNYDDIRNLWNNIISVKKANIKVLDMPLLNTTSTASSYGLTGKMLSNVFLEFIAYLAESERKAIKERQRQGILSAKNRGVRFGRNFKLSEVEFRIIDQKIQSGELSISKACRDMKISRNCYYKTKERLELIAE